MPDDTAVTYTKMAEPIGMPFELWTRVGPGSMYLVRCALAPRGECH